MAGLGEIRVDLIADIARFTSNLQKASNHLDRWAKTSSDKIKAFEKTTREVGTKLSLALTAPLAAMGVAAVRAADPTGKVGQEIERLGLQAQQAIKPLGEVLIRLFEEARPTIEATVGVLNNLSLAFAGLDPQVQSLIVGSAALVAAIGPALIALSGLGAVARVATVSVLKLGSWSLTTGRWLVGTFTSGVATAATAVGKLARSLTLASTATGTLTTGLVSLGGVIAAIVAAVSGFEIGRWAYDEFKIVRNTAAAVIEFFQNGFERVKYAGLVAWDVLKEGLDRAVVGMKQTLYGFADFATGILESIPDALLMGMNISPVAVQALRSRVDTLNDPVGTFDLAASLRKRGEVLQEALDFNERVFQESARQFEEEFGGKDRKGRGLAAFVAADIQAAKEAFEKNFPQLAVAASRTAEAIGTAAGWPLDKIVSMYQAIETAARSLLDVAPLPFVQTRKEAEEATKAAKAMEEQLKSLRAKAEDLHLAVNPAEKLAQEIHEILELQAMFPEILSESDALANIAKLEEGFKHLGTTVEQTFGEKIEKTIQGFARSAGDAFADLVVDGKASFDQLLKGWAKTLLSMASQQLVFQPLFDALGSVARASLSPRTANALGNVFAGGSLVPFATGGIVNSPTLFPMARGMGLMGEAGPEAVMPLERIGGKLGVSAAGAGTVVNVIDQRGTGSPVSVSRQMGPGGRETISVLIRDEVRRMLGAGGLDRDLAAGFGIPRRGVAR